MVVPIAVGGSVFFTLALLGRGPARLVAASRIALEILSGLVACLSLYLLGSAGVAFKLASGDQMAEAKFYRRTLDQFALLEAAQGRYDKLRETFLNTRDAAAFQAWPMSGRIHRHARLHSPLHQRCRAIRYFVGVLDSPPTTDR